MSIPSYLHLIKNRNNYLYCSVLWFDAKANNLKDSDLEMLKELGESDFAAFLKSEVLRK